MPKVKPYPAGKRDRRHWRTHGEGTPVLSRVQGRIVAGKPGGTAKLVGNVPTFLRISPVRWR